MKQHIIMDCCGSGGDLTALRLVSAFPKALTLLGITVFAPEPAALLNQVEKTGVGVYPGCPRPFFPLPSECFETELRSSSARTEVPSSRHGVDFLIETLLQAEQKITLIALGPLTNIALALVREPRIRQNIEKIVISGGAVGQGDITPAAEHNFYRDPHAAAIVLSAKVPVTLLTVDLVPDPSVRGACAVASLLDPSLFEGARQVTVSVDCGDGVLRGRSCIDWWGKLGLPPQATVFESLDLPKIQDLLHPRKGASF